MSKGFWDGMGYTEKVGGGKAKEGEENGAPPPAEEPPVEEVGPGQGFGFYRGVRDRSPVLEFRLKQGEPEAIKYAFFRSAVGGHDERLVLYFVPGDKVTLHGKGLRRIKDLIYAERMTWIQELSRQEAHGLDSAVTLIEIEINHEAEPAGQDREQEPQQMPRRASGRG